MRTKKRAVLSAAVAGLLLALSHLPLPFALAEWLFWPAEMLSSIGWPEGIHSAGGALSVVAMLAFVWLFTLLLWSAAVFSALTLLTRVSPNNSSKPTPLRGAA